MHLIQITAHLAILSSSFSHSGSVLRKFYSKANRVLCLSTQSNIHDIYKKKDAMHVAQELNPNTPAIILVRTTLSENIGACARAMLNFGLVDLRLVEPECNHLTEASIRRSSGAEEVLNNAKVFKTIPDALHDLTTVFATTARTRDMTCIMSTPERAFQKFLSSHDIGNIGVLFGPEASGLTNSDLSYCTSFLYIPTQPAFSSLNLAQAVNLVAYEYWKVTMDLKNIGKVQTASVDSEEVVSVVKGRGKLASHADVDGLSQRLEKALDERSFQPVPAHRELVYQQLRAVLNRTMLSEKEVKLLHGIITSLTEGPKQSRKESTVPFDSVNSDGSL